ncbi:hypothetical protein IQ07DRAFT_586335 [Pyrenochaeta sp. DS3sAY3a]|nr:hypothetical protein IQ07DRAFT_586335 [Pyrenochaeta sp. DS3sAY3a]
MWSRLTGRSDSGSSASNRDRERDRDEEARRRRLNDSTRVRRDRDSDTRSVVSSMSTRKPSRRDTAPSSIASFATAFDEMPRSRANDDLYEDPRDDRSTRRREDRPSSYAASSASTTRRDRSRSRDRDDKDRKKSRDKDKDRKTEKRRSTRSSTGASQASGYRGDIVESPKPIQRTFSDQVSTSGFSQFPGQAGAPMMSGALPSGSQHHSDQMSSHVQDQFPGQNPSQYASSALPGGNPFGAAADYYNDQGESVNHQPGVRPQPPSVIIGQDTPHLMSAAAQPNPVADTGSGAAADFYGTSNDTPSSSKPPRPSTSSFSMPGSFVEEGPAPQKPPRPSSKPGKTNSFGTAATMAGGAALGYALGHSSSGSQQQSTSYSTSNIQHSTSYNNGASGTSSNQPTSYTNGGPCGSSSMYYQGQNPSTAATDGSSYLPPYAGPNYSSEGIPPQKPPRPGKKPEKQSSGSNAGLYAAAGAAGLAAYGLHKHNSNSNSQHTSQNYSSSTPGAFPGQQYNGNGVNPSAAPLMAGGMAQRHVHEGPVSRFVDWWKDYEDIQKMEEYTEYIGVCKGCFDPRSSILDAPRKHHFHKRRSNEYMRPSGGIEKQSRYPLKEKRSHNSLSSGDERRKRTSNSAAGWVAAGLGGLGLAKAGKAVLTSGRDDFDDTYSIKSGRESHGKNPRRSRSRSRDRKSYSYGSSEIRRRSRSRDRLSQMSVGVTKDKKDYKIVRRRSRSRSSSSSSSNNGKSGLIGAAIGAGLAGAALNAATKKKQRSRSRSPKKVFVQHHRRDSSDDERRRRRSQQLRRKSSRSSTSGASVIEIGQTHQSQGGFLGGFFAAPPPKQKREKAPGLKKKKTGFFNFGNASVSSSDSDIAFGTGFVRRRRRTSPKRRNSDERLKATLAGLGATAAAIAAAKAGKSASKRHSEVVAVKEQRHGRKSSDRPRPGSRYGDDEWEDLPDDGTSDSSNDNGLVYGDYDWRKGKSQESLVSNGSGTNKWGWRWGFGKKKRRSSDNLYDNIAGTSFIGPSAAAATGAAAGLTSILPGFGRHGSESSSAATLQSVYPVQSNDPIANFDARRNSAIPTPQPLVTSGPGTISIQQPQPMHQVPGAIYSTQPSTQSGFTAPAGPGFAAPGPSVFSQSNTQNIYQTQYQTQNFQAPLQPAIPSSLRRTNSSPIQGSSWKRDTAIAGIAATAGGLAGFAAAKGTDRPPSAASNVRFNLTKEQADKAERERRKERDREEEEDRRRRDEQKREDEARRAEEQRIRLEQQRRDEEAREEERRVRIEQQRREDELRKVEDDRRREQLLREDEERREEERRRRELQRQQEEARKYMEAERLAKLEAERRVDERRRQQEELQIREAREAKERDQRERDAREAHEAKRRADLEAEELQMRTERRNAERREAERVEAARREAEIREDTERRRREREAQDYADRFESDRERRRLEQQPTGSSVSSVATDVRRKEQELQQREHDLVQPDTWKTTAAGAVAAGAAAAITTAAISSYKDKRKDEERERERDRDRDSRRDSSSTTKTFEPSNKSYSSYDVKPTEPSTTKIYEPSNVKTYEPSNVKTYEPSNVKTFEPSRIEQDYFDDEIFDPNMFKKKKDPVRDVYKDWEDRYNEKPVSQADFFAPKELLENSNLPKVQPVDPNGDATDIHIYQAHDEPDISHAMIPPYPARYSFSTSQDSRSTSSSSWGVPSLNLIQPTPPGSRAPSIRSVSVPPSPNIEPIKEEPKEEPKQEANRARSRVSWGENQFHHFEVQTPDSIREEFMSKVDLKDQEKKYSHDEVTVEHESPKLDQKTVTYQAYRPEYATVSETKEIPASTQFVRDKDEPAMESVASVASKKTSKKEKKKAKAAAAAAVTAVTAAALLSRDDEGDRDYKRETASVISNPFSDSHAAHSVIAPSTVASSIPTSSSVYQSPQYQSDLDLRKDSKKINNGAVFTETAITAEPAHMHIPGSFDEPLPEEEPTWQERGASINNDTKGKEVQSTDDSIVTKALPRRDLPVSEPIKEAIVESEVKLSKKDRKKKAKAAKRASIDSWEESDTSPLSSPTVERDIRDVEPSWATSSARPVITDAEKPRSSESTSASKTVGAAMAGGFAALVGNAMKQDQERMASDLEHARQNLESAEQYSAHHTSKSPTNGTHTINRTENTTSTSQDAMIPSEASTPKRKKDKRHGSGVWSPTVGSPLRSEMKHDDYIGPRNKPTGYEEQPLVEAPKAPTESAFGTSSDPSISRAVYDSGYYAPDDLPPTQPERDSDEFFSAGSEERERSKAKARDLPKQEDYESKVRNKHDEYESKSPRKHDEYESKSPRKYDEYESKSPRKYDEYESKSPRKHDDDDVRSVVSSSSKYDDPEREERRRRRDEAKPESREPSRDWGYDFDDGSERKRRHRRRGTDERSDDWDTRSTISEARSEANGERRRKHKRRESERDGSTESKHRSRSSAASEPGDIYDERKPSKRRSKRDGDDDNASVISSSSRYDEDRSPKKEKEKEKRSSGLFGIFSKSKENLADTTSKSSKSKDDDDEERKHRRRKHRSDRGSTYGSDDDDNRSTISSSSRREKRSSRSERGDGERRDSYDDKVHRFSSAR